MKPRTKGKRISVVSGVILLTVLMVTTWFFLDHIRFWRLFESLGRNEQGLMEYRYRQTGIVMVRVPAGTFLMGSPEGEEGAFLREHPQHEVTLSPFLMAKYEVTQLKWEKIMGSNRSEFKGDTLPVAASWNDCQEFCKNTGLRFPTEAQWEYACRAGTTGNYGGTGKLDEMGWYDRNTGNLHPPGEKELNQFGLYDMHGNVFEWCEDIYDPEFYKHSEASRTNPLCTSGPNGFRVVRGGSWDFDANGCRSAYRYRYGPAKPKPYHQGFRPAYRPLP